MSKNHKEMNQDSEYLKRYIEGHPNNQMAWYLLGREYSAKEQYQKAEFCFKKAGEVYKVFEQIPIVERPDGQRADDSAREQWDVRSENKSRLMRRTLFMTLILLLLYIPIKSPSLNSNDSLFDLNGVEPTISENLDLSAVVATDKIQVYYTVEAQDRQQLEKALTEMILPTSLTFKTSILVQASLTIDSHWINWLGQPKMLLSADRIPSEGKLNIAYHDAQSCLCIPGNAAQTIRNFAYWQKEQEQRMVLSSAINTYQQQNNEIPESVEGLANSYPGNILSGYTPFMEELSVQWLSDAVSQGNEDPMDPVPENVFPNHNNKPYTVVYPADEQLKEPLEIIVDKQNYRLALVSGQVILRNYPVGLGGDKTPEGEFTITEKVRNPNGKSDGDFGSRGLTLSDTLYAIHGTNQPDSIGKDASLGCIRMLKEDIEELFAMTPKGTKVTIANGGLPEELIRSKNPFSVPVLIDETNPDKVYKWLN